MKSQKKKNKENSKKKRNLKKKMKRKNFQYAKMSEVNQCQCHTMSGSS